MPALGDALDFANLDDLWYYDSVLRDLDAQDEDSDIAAQREPVDDSQHETPRSTRSSRPRRYSASKRQSYKEESETDEEEVPGLRASRRGKEYADARQGVIDRIRKVTRQLRACSDPERLTLGLVQACPGLLEAHAKASDFLKDEKWDLVALKRPQRKSSGSWRDYLQREDECVAFFPFYFS